MHLRLGPGLHLGLRAHRGLYPRRALGLDLRWSLRRYLGLAGGAAAGLQLLVFSFLLPPLLRRQTPGAGG